MQRFRRYFCALSSLFKHAPVLPSFAGVVVVVKKRIGGALFVYFGVLVVLLSLSLFFFYVFYNMLLAQRNTLERTLAYWETAAVMYPRSAQIQYNVAYYAARVGAGSRALVAVEEALYLDPEFEEAYELREEIYSM